MPVDSTAMWLAQFPTAELCELNPRSVDASLLKRHIDFGELENAIDALHKIQACGTRDSVKQRFGGPDAPTVRFMEFWKQWGLSDSHQIPAEWIECRSSNGTFPRVSISTPEGTLSHRLKSRARQSFETCVRYLFLVEYSPDLIRATYDLCAPEPA